MPPTSDRRSRTRSDEAYVVSLCDEILGETALRQHRFDWLRGDPGRSGRTIALPVDAYYPAHRLVVEYRERQHGERVAIMDDRSTISGVPRGVQRQIYDRRREDLIPRHGLRLVIVNARDLCSDRRGRLLRSDERADREMLRALLSPGP